MTPKPQANSWTVKQALVTSAFCLVMGISIGFVAHGPNSAKAVVATSPTTSLSEALPAIAAPISTPNPSPDQLKAASRQAAVPVLERLQKDPKNFKLLVQAGEMYYHHGAFTDAASFYTRALDVKDNPAVRNQLASTLFYQGKPNQALEQYQRVLQSDPKNEIALFNTGMVRFKTMNDPKGAIASWEKLLKAYPNHPQRRQVQGMIDKAAKQQG
jgi:cytochrome c-type biogenesis protein CcmH/NrfG